MMVDFFLKLRAYGLPVTLRELLDLLSALEARVIDGSIDDFYGLSRLCLVKDETHYDRFDLAFRDFFEGVQGLAEVVGEIPHEWLRKEVERLLSEEEKARIKGLGFEELMRTLAQRLAEQEKRHQGGSKMIGTAGTSPFGAYGYNPEGVRIGQTESRHRRAVKVWDERRFRNFADDVEVGTRNLKLALRKLRRFARAGAAEELDLDEHDPGHRAQCRAARPADAARAAQRGQGADVPGCRRLDGRSRQAGRGAVLGRAQRVQASRVLTISTIVCTSGSGATTAAAHAERIPTIELLRTFAADYKVLFVGDATMSPYELAYAGGASEHHNEEPGAKWLARVRETWRKAVWLNPQPQDWWDAHQSIQIVQRLFEGRMFPLTLAGLDAAIRELR